MYAPPHRQVLGGLLRPHKPHEDGRPASTARVAWLWFHRALGLGVLVLAAESQIARAGVPDTEAVM